MQYGVIKCNECNHTWPEELPPLWLDLLSQCWLCGSTNVCLQHHLIDMAEKWSGVTRHWARIRDERGEGAAA